MNIQVIKEWFFNIASIIIMWLLLHFTAANLYARFCAELSIFGFIKSIFVAEAPHCVAMRWVIYNSGSVIHTMWISIGIWIMGKMFKHV